MITEIEMTGMAELDRALDGFSAEVAGNVIRPALAWGARVFRNAIVARAKATFQAQSGDLFRGIDTEVQVAGRTGRFGFGRGAVIRWKIGMRKSAKAPYPRFWERGFRHIGRGKGKRARLRRGQLQARQITRGVSSGGFQFLRREFMRPAFEGVYRQVLDGISARLRAGVEAAAAQFRKAA